MKSDPTKCNVREEAFCLVFHQLHDKVKAFCLAYDAGEDDRDIRSRVAREMRKPRVAARLAELQRASEAAVQLVVQAEIEKRERTQTSVIEAATFDARAVMQHWLDVATADPLKIIQHRRLNCRHCHGKDHRYQWEDKNEFTRATADAIDTNLSRKRGKLEARELPSDAGGYGWRFNAMPHPTCPKCGGEGLPDVLIVDTNLLDTKERKLIKSIRMKKGDVEIIMHDQSAALVNVAKAYGMLVEKFKMVDPNEPTDIPALPLDPVEASRVYAQLVKGH